MLSSLVCLWTRQVRRRRGFRFKRARHPHAGHLPAILTDRSELSTWRKPDSTGTARMASPARPGLVAKPPFAATAFSRQHVRQVPQGAKCLIRHGFAAWHRSCNATLDDDELERLVVGVLPPASFAKQMETPWMD
jgi:hypothetical protein